PTCELTQAVIRPGVGIRTPSITFPSYSVKLLLIVLSELTCDARIVTARISKLLFSVSRSALLKFVMWSKSVHDLTHNHSYTCFARNPCSPIAVSLSFKSDKLKLLISINLLCCTTMQR